MTSAQPLIGPETSWSRSSVSEEQIATELLKREDARESLIRFTEFTKPDYRTAAAHHKIAAALEKVERGEIDRLMLLVAPRHGKALQVDTPIPTPRGWSRIGDLKAGDAVFDENGETCRVVAVSPVWRGRPVYSVQTDDGDEIIADADHEWRVRPCRKNKKFLLKTSQEIAERTDRRLVMIEAQGALKLPEAILPIDPYVLGVWLGDGRTKSSAICSADLELVNEVSRIEGGHNEYAAKGKTRHFRVGPHFRQGATTQCETLQGRLRTLGLLGNKHIPIEYLRASQAQRLALLQGLVDTDGYVAKDGQIEFCTIRPGLADDVKELVHSLGHKASLIVGRATLNGRDCGPKYRVMFYMAGAARLERKRVKCRHGMRAFRRYIAVEHVGTADTVCIQVDSPSHMFLAGKSMLPTHNSELASRRFPAFYLGRRPDRQFISVSANAEMATDFGRDVRNIIRSEEYRGLFSTTLAEDSQAKGKWNTTEGGIYYAVGIGGQIMGRGAHVMLIDDPFATMADALSELERKNVWDWYTGTAYNRLMPGGAIVLINHRMHEEDLSGMLLHQQAAGGDKWEVVELPAIDERGDALWPEAYPLEALERIRTNSQARFWSALYQQKPSPDEGDYFRAEWLNPYVVPPAGLKIYGASDFAVTSEGGDYTVHVIVGVSESRKLYLLDVWRLQSASNVWIEAMIRMIQQWKPLAWAAEAGQIKAALKPFIDDAMRRAGAYCWLKTFPTKGDKGIRARSIQGRMAVDGMYVPEHAKWFPEFRHELLSFPAGKHDDQVDAIGLIGQLLLEPYTDTKPVEKKPDRLEYWANPDGSVIANMDVKAIVEAKRRQRERDW